MSMGGKIGDGDGPVGQRPITSPIDRQDTHVAMGSNAPHYPGVGEPTPYQREQPQPWTLKDFKQGIEKDLADEYEEHRQSARPHGLVDPEEPIEVPEGPHEGYYPPPYRDMRYRLRK